MEMFLFFYFFNLYESSPLAPFQKKNSPHKSGQSKQMIMVLENDPYPAGLG